MLSHYDELLVIGLMLVDPNVFLREVCHKVNSLAGVSVADYYLPHTSETCFNSEKKHEKLHCKTWSCIYRGDFIAEMYFLM